MGARESGGLAGAFGAYGLQEQGFGGRFVFFDQVNVGDVTELRREVASLNKNGYDTAVPVQSVFGEGDEALVEREVLVDVVRRENRDDVIGLPVCVVHSFYETIAWAKVEILKSGGIAFGTQDGVDPFGVVGIFAGS